MNVFAPSMLLVSMTAAAAADDFSDAWSAFSSAIAKKDGKKVWALLASESHEFFERPAKSAREAAADPEFAEQWCALLEIPKHKLKDVTGESLVVKLVDLQDREKPHNHFAIYRDAKFRDAQQMGDAAKGTISRADGKGYESIGYAREGRVWKVKVEKTRFVWQ